MFEGSKPLFASRINHVEMKTMLLYEELQKLEILKMVVQFYWYCSVKVQDNYIAVVPRC